MEIPRSAQPTPELLSPFSQSPQELTEDIRAYLAQTEQSTEPAQVRSAPQDQAPLSPAAEGTALSHISLSAQSPLEALQAQYKRGELGPSEFIQKFEDLRMQEVEQRFESGAITFDQMMAEVEQLQRYREMTHYPPAPEESSSWTDSLSNGWDSFTTTVADGWSKAIDTVGDAAFDAAGFAFRKLTDVQPIGDAPIDISLLEASTLTHLSDAQIESVAVRMLEMANTEDQTVFSNEFTSEGEGHQYMGVGEAVMLSPDQVSAVQAEGENAIKMFISQFPNGADVINGAAYDTLTAESMRLNMRSFLEDSLASGGSGSMVDINDFEGSNLTGQRILLGTGSIVDIHNHKHIETDRHIINTMTPHTTELHPLRGAVTWVHIVDKETGKSMFGNFGAGDHHSQMVDLGNNVLIQLGMFNEVGKKAVANLQGEDYDPLSLRAFGLGERLNSVVSFFNLNTEREAAQ